MIARAPGKLVLSGAYAVLQGAPALVCAVDRYVSADAARPAAFVTPELRAAFGDAPVPWFDASPLRSEQAKLGLGSSAAIVVACLGSAELARAGRLDDRELCARVYPAALAAHRAAQPSGSGIDVAAICHGGHLCARRVAGELELAPLALPPALHLSVWSSGVPAATADMLRRVHDLARRERPTYERLMGAQGTASETAAEAAAHGDAAGLVAALAAQTRALSALGRAAGVEIVTPAGARLAERAEAEGAAVLPSGAGGGDIVLYAGRTEPSAELRALAAELGHSPLDLTLGARGVHAA